MQVGDILDEVFFLFRKEFVLLVGVAAVIYVPYYILETLAGIGRPLEMGAARWGLLLLQVAILQQIVAGALSYAVSEKHLGRQASVGNSYRFIARRAVSLIATLVLAGFVELLPFAVGTAIGVGLIASGVAVLHTSTLLTIAAIVAGIPLMLAGLVFTTFLAVRFMVVLPVFVIEGVSGVSALRRSSKLVAGFGLKVLGVVMLSQLIVGLLTAAVSVPPQIAMQFAASAGRQGAVTALFGLSEVLEAVASSILVPVVALTYVLIYYDLRIRKEGFDLEILAQDLEQRRNVLPAEL